MSTFRLSSLLSVAALSLGLTIPAGATSVTLTSGMTSTQVGAATTDFETTPSNVTFSGASGIVSGNSFDQYSAPTGDTTKFAYAGVGGVVTESFATPITYLGLYWGSPDSYNTLTVTDTNGVTTAYVPGQGILSSLTPNQQTAQYVNFFDTGAAWKSVTFTSSLAAFEFDNVASFTATPEPASLALLAGGLLTVGILRRRKSS